VGKKFAQAFWRRKRVDQPRRHWKNPEDTKVKGGLYRTTNGRGCSREKQVSARSKEERRSELVKIGTGNIEKETGKLKAPRQSNWGPFCSTRGGVGGPQVRVCQKSNGYICKRKKVRSQDIGEGQKPILYRKEGGMGNGEFF